MSLVKHVTIDLRKICKLIVYKKLRIDYYEC